MNDGGVLLMTPFTLDPGPVLAGLGLTGAGDLESEVLGILREAGALLRPKSFHVPTPVGHIGPDAVELGGITFRNGVLTSKLEGTNEVYPYVATCGTEIEPLCSATTDALLGYALDCAKGIALRAAVSHLQEYAQGTLGVGHVASMSPGAGDANLWPISQQTPLFRLLTAHGDPAGVTLTDSLLMVPNKSVSGILFPSEGSFASCQLCKREGCPNRVAPFDGEAWAKAGL